MKKLLSLLCLLTCLVGSVYGKTTLTIASQSMTTKVGMSDKRLVITATDPNGNIAYGLSYTYSGYNTDVISVASNGVITGVGEGTTAVTVSFAGNDDYEAVTATGVITVNVTKQTPVLTVSDQTVAVKKTTNPVSVTATDENGDVIEDALTYAFTSSNINVAAVSSTGVVTGVANGSATITVSFEGNSMYSAATTTFAVTVVTAGTLPMEYFDGLNNLSSQAGKGMNPIGSHYGFFTITAFSGKDTSGKDRSVINGSEQFSVQNGAETTPAGFTIAATGNNIVIKSITLYTNTNSRSFTSSVAGTQTQNKGKNWKYDFTGNVSTATFNNVSSNNIAVSAIEIEYELQEGIYFLPQTAEVTVNGTYNLKDNNMITQGNVGTVTFSSSNSNYASVTSTGVVTGLFPGQVVITATDGTYTATCTVDITGTSGRAQWDYDADTYTLTFGPSVGWLPETISDNPYLDMSFGATNERQYYGAPAGDGKNGTYAIDAYGYSHVYASNEGIPSMGSYYVLTPSLLGHLTISGWVKDGINKIVLVNSEGTVVDSYLPSSTDFEWTVNATLMMEETYYLYGTTAVTPNQQTGNYSTLCLQTVKFQPAMNYTYPQTWAYNGEWFSTSTDADLMTEAAQNNWSLNVNTFYNTESYLPVNASLEESAGQSIQVFDGDWMLYTAKNAGSIGIIPSVYVSLKADGSCITIPRVPTGYYVIVQADFVSSGAGISINGRERSLTAEIQGYFYRNTKEQNVVINATSGEMRIYSIAVVNDYNATRFEFCSATNDATAPTKKNAFRVNYNWYADTHPDNANKGATVVIRNPLDVPNNVKVKYTFPDSPEGYYFNGDKTVYEDNSGNMTITIPSPSADETYTMVKADYSESLGLDEGAKVAYFRLDVHKKTRGGRYAPEAGTKAPKTGGLAIVDGMTMTYGGWRDYKQYESGSKDYQYNGELYDAYKKPAADAKGVPMGYYGQVSGNQNPLNENLMPYYNDQKNMFLVPCRGTFYKFEPMVDGLLTVNLLQNGVLQNKPEELNFGTLSRRVLYMVDETGENIQTVTQQTGDLNYPFGVSVPRLATMNVPLYIIKKKNGDNIVQKMNTDWGFNYVYGGLQEVKYLSQDKMVDGYNLGGGYAVVSEAVTYYSFPVKAGKTYYLFVRGSKLGLYGWEFDPTNRGTEEIIEVTLSENDANPSIQATSQAKITSFDRTLNFGAWNALVLPYSMNEQQVRTLLSGNISAGMSGVERELADGVMDMVYFDRVEGNAMYFKRHYYRTIVAGKPCLVKPIQGSGVSATQPLKTSGNNLSRGVSGHGNIDYQLVTITDVPAESTETNDDYTWSASYGKQTIKPGDYYLNAAGNIIRRSLTSSAVEMKGFRAFLSDESGDATNRAEIVNAALFDVEEGNATVNGITEVVIEDEQGREIERIPANEVFGLDGKKVSDNDTKSLQKGIYVKNGKKIVVK